MRKDMKTSIIILLTALLLLAACSVQKINQGANVKEDIGYLRLNGIIRNRQVYINGNSVGVDPEDDVQRYALKAGLYKLEIRSSNRILLAQDVLISGGQTVDISVS